MVDAVSSSQSAPRVAAGAVTRPLPEIRSDIGRFLDRIMIGKQPDAKQTLNELREPDGMAATAGVLSDMRHHVKPVPIEQ